jgi:hypothetical protein
MNANPPKQTRREVMAAMAIAGLAGAFGSKGYAAGHDRRSTTAGGLASHAHDWDWLVGDWDVWHRRLKERLAGSNDWEEFAGKSVFWRTLDGLGNIDDNSLDLPDGVYRGLSIRAFDPAARQWAIWWLDGRNPARIDPPVVGSFEADSGTFVGKDVFKGRPITMRFRWHEVHGPRPHWDQAFSTDSGATWEINWRNYFTRTNAKPTSLPRMDDAPRDWDFLVGNWQVRNRRLKQGGVGSAQWEEFDSTLVNWPVLGGHGNVGDNVFNVASGSHRGVSVRAFDPATRQWMSWWLDGRSPTRIAPPVSGTFKDGVGTLIGNDVSDGKPIKVRSQWSRITTASPRWEQASSLDGGTTWETNWVADFVRKA